MARLTGNEGQAVSHQQADRGRSVLKRMVFLDQNVEMLLDGLLKAGLEAVD